MRYYDRIPWRVRALAGLLCILVGVSLLWQPAVPAHVHGAPDAAADAWMPGGWTLNSVSRQGGTINGSFLETFNGSPTSPTAYSPPGWDVDIHSRDFATWKALEVFDDTGTHPYLADHDPTCQAPPLQHDPTTSYPPRVFQCHDHVMTAIKADGYGIIYLTPPAMLDWSQGEATLSWDVSTRRTSLRDWIDVWITPYDEASKFPLEDSFVVDAAGSPVDTFQLQMSSFNGLSTFNANTKRAGVQEFIGPSWGFTWPSVDAVVSTAGGTSAVRRDTFELKISSNHVGFRMPQYPDSTGWIDDTLSTPLAFTKGIVQFGHHSYFPQKGCEGFPDPDPLTGLPPLCPGDTWHWDNVSLSPAVPIKITRLTSPRQHAFDSGTDTWTFPAAIDNSDTTLRFVAVNAPGGVPQFDVNFGSGWTTYDPVITGAPAQGDDHARGYSIPVPIGATHAQVRGQGGPYGIQWKAEDAALYLPYDPDIGIPATPTPLPAGTATAVAATQTALAQITPVTLTPTPAPATLTPIPTITPGATATPRPTNTPIVIATPTPGGISTCDVLGRRDGQPARLPFPFC